MELTWHGLSCFRLTERHHASVITDPYNAKKIGLNPLKAKTDVVTISHDAVGHNDTSAVSGYSHVLNGPGEYEIGGVFISGISTYSSGDDPQRNLIFVFDFNGVKVAHLGDITRVPNQSQIDALETVDILLIPVGGGGSLNAGKAAELVSMIEPSIVVPMHYQQPGLKIELEEVERFIKEMGASDVEVESSLKITSSSMPEETQLVLLAAKGNEA